MYKQKINEDIQILRAFAVILTLINHRFLLVNDGWSQVLMEKKNRLPLSIVGGISIF
jgi:hypothetical protein